MSSALPIVLLGCACLSSSLVVGGYLLYQNSNTTPAPQEVALPVEDPAPAPKVETPPPKADLVTAPAPPKPKPTTPRDRVLDQGQKIQVDEFNLNEAIGAADPTGIDKKKVTYTMSLDIKLDGLIDRNFPVIFSNTDSPVPWPTKSAQQGPILIITSSHRGPSYDRNRLIVYHGSDPKNDGVRTKFQAPEGQYFNLTWTVENGLLSVYIDGKLDRTVKGAFTWSDKPNKWSWNPQDHEMPISIKNVYWFNKALSASEVALIGKKQTSGVSAYTLRYELGNEF